MSKDQAKWHLGQAAVKGKPDEAIVSALLGIGNALMLLVEEQERTNELQKRAVKCMTRDLKMKTGECMFGEGCENEVPTIHPAEDEALVPDSHFGVWGSEDPAAYLRRLGLDEEEETNGE